MASPVYRPHHQQLKTDTKNYVIIDDSGHIYRAMNSYGQVFMILAKYCRDTGTHYQCEDYAKMTQCRPSTDLDKFVFKEILPRYFPDECRKGKLYCP